MTGKGLTLTTIMVALAPLLLLRSGAFNVVLFITPVLAVYLLLEDFERRVRLPAFQIVAVVLLLSTTIALFGPPSASLVGSLVMIPLLGMVLGYREGKSLVEVLAHSSIFGIAITVALLLLSVYISELFTYLIYLVAVLSAVYLLVRTRSRKVEVTIDSYFLLFLVVSAFYLTELIAVSHTYFRQTMNDIVRHMFYARVLIQDPGRYLYAYYVGYHSLLGALIVLSKEFPLNVALASSAFSFLSAFLIYASLSRFEEKKFAFFTWSLLVSLTWILAPLYGTSYEGLAKLSLVGYYSLTWSHPMFFWGMPQVLVLGLMFTTLTTRDPGFKESLLMPMAALTLISLMHLPEGVMLAGLIAFRPLLKRDGLNKQLSLAAVVAGAMALAVYLLILKRLSPVNLVSLLSITASGALGLILLKLNWSLEKVNLKSIPVKSLAAATYLAGIAVWLLNFGSIDVKSLFNIGYVPWFYYPVLLGVAGILAILSPSWREFSDLFLLALMAFTAGKVASLIKLSGVSLPYWEYRVIPVIALALSLPASAYVKKVSEGRGKLSSVALIGIVLLGYPSLALSFQRWYDVAHSNKYQPLTLEEGDVLFLSGKDIKSRTLAFAYKSAMAVALNTAHVVRGVPPWYSNGPEVANYYMYHFNVSNVFFSEIDRKLARDENLSSYLLMMYNQRGEVPSLERAHPSRVVLNSTLAVIFPSDVHYYRKAVVLYHLIGERLPPHVTYMSYDPSAPADGLYIGPPSNVTFINESLPDTPWDLRWLLITGNFSEGLSVKGGKGLAISTYELDQGSFSVKFCPTIPEGSVGLIYNFKNLKNYYVARYEFRGVLTLLRVAGGVARPLGIYKAPTTENCVNLTLNLENGSSFLLVNGLKYPVKVGEKLGLLGVETYGFRGKISGNVHGVHSLKWNPPPGANLLNLEDERLSYILDRAVRDVSSTEVSNLSIPGLSSQPLPSKPPNYVALKMMVEGDVKLTGYLVKYISLKGEEKLVGRHVTLTPERIYFLGGKGFYVYLGVEGKEGNGTYVFRVPVNIKFSGSGFIYGHPFRRVFVERLSKINILGGRITILMADKSSLLRINVRRAVGTTKLPIDEVPYALEGLAIAFLIFLTIRRLLPEG